MATPRKSEYPLADPRRSCIIRSAGGARPGLIVWVPAPLDSVLDRLARAGFAVVTLPEDAALEDLEVLLEGLPRGAFGGNPVTPLGVLFPEAPPAGASDTLDAGNTPWLEASNDDWDGALRWMAERLT